MLYIRAPKVLLDNLRPLVTNPIPSICPTYSSEWTKQLKLISWHPWPFPADGWGQCLTPLEGRLSPWGTPVQWWGGWWHRRSRPPRSPPRRLLLFWTWLWRCAPGRGLWSSPKSHGIWPVSWFGIKSLCVAVGVYVLQLVSWKWVDILTTVTCQGLYFFLNRFEYWR